MLEALVVTCGLGLAAVFMLSPILFAKRPPGNGWDSGGSWPLV